MPLPFRNAEDVRRAAEAWKAANPGMYATEDGARTISSLGFDGLTSYAGPSVINEGNSSYVINPATGQKERAFQGGTGGHYLESDLIGKYGSLDAAQKAAIAAGASPFEWSSAKQSSNDPMDIVKSVAPLVAGYFTGGLLGGVGGGLAASGLEAAGVTPAAAAATTSGLATGGSVLAGVAAGDVLLAGGGGTDALTGEPMWDWLDGVDLGGVDDISGGYNVGGGFDMGGGITVDEYGNVTGGLFEGGPGTPGSGDFYSGFDGGGISDLLKSGGKFLPNLFGGGARKGSALSGMSPVDIGLGVTPFLLALTEANRQSGDLNSVINKINGAGYTDAILHPYDMETGANRTSLLNDLSLRGVSGSSFGNQQIGNYDYLRALGRGDLASKATLSAAGLEGNLINQRNTNRNLLLGAGLNASGRMFSPQPDPFNLRSLLGGP